MRVRLAVVVSIVTLAVSACAGPPGAPRRERAAPPGRASLPAETLVLGTVDGPIAVQAPAGSVVLRAPGAVASPDGSLVYSTSTRGATTTLETRSAATGERVAAARVRGDLQVRAVSGSGRAAALMEPLPNGWDPWTPIPRGRTTMVVADPSGDGEARRYELEGNFEPEAFSTDDRSLFLIEHLPAQAPTVYRVTRLDLNRGRVFPVFGPFKAPAERMPGTRLQQVASPDGGQLYTLYSSARAGYAPHDVPVASTAVVAFIHVLDLDEDWAHCVGLPEAMWDRPASAQAMAAAPDGRALYVVDAELGIVARMDAETLQVRTGDVDLPATDEIERTTATMSADGRTLFVGTGGSRSTVTAIDVASFETVGDWSLDGTVSGLGRSADGSRVYAALGDRVVVLDPRSGFELGTVPLQTPGPVTSVVALAA
jgi:hypothetical protein